MEHRITDAQGRPLVTCGGALAAAQWCREHGYTWQQVSTYNEPGEPRAMVLRVIQESPHGSND